jgi:tetratricopeptide (TPR) repeat protein
VPKYRQDELANIHKAYFTGRELADSGQMEAAIPYFDKVIGRLPRRRRDRVYRVDTPALTRRTATGIHWLPTVFRDALLAKAYCLNELGRFDDAFAVLERAAELDPENPQVYAELGFTHGSKDNIEMARTAYEIAAKLEPENTAHLRALAHIALVAEEFEKARLLAEQAIALEPENVNSLHHLAYAEYRMGNLEAAIQHLQYAFTLDPEDIDSALRLAGTLREAGRLREAVGCLHTYLGHDPHNPEALGLMSELLQADGTAPELMPHVERLLARNPRDPIALELLAWGHFQQGRQQESVAVLRRLVNFEPMQPYYHFKLGMMYQMLGNLPLAMASLLRAMALDEHGEVGSLATEAIANLDQVQIEQMLSHAEHDPVFRYHLHQNPELTIRQSGYLLSPLGMQMLDAFEAEDGPGFSRDMRTPTIH